MYGSTQQPHSTAPLFQKPARSQPSSRSNGEAARTPPSPLLLHLPFSSLPHLHTQETQRETERDTQGRDRYERDQKKNNFRWTSHSSTSTSSAFCLSRRPRQGQTDIQKQIRRRLGSDGRDILRPRSK
ncbi:hypothetical protein BDL97_19G091700 [Sphagnum fallax]|nr:hypothetical protein BDL97_19G091700 [Sphagnum fallax]